jgi:hypothetical protein
LTTELSEQGGRGAERRPMGSIRLYEDEIEKKQHDLAVRKLAEDLRRSEEEVRTLYEKELERLKPRARVKDFLTVIVTREVKNLLRDARMGSTAGVEKTL